MDDLEILQNMEEEESSPVDLARIKSAIWKWKWLIVGCLVAGIFVTAILVRNYVPKYRVYATLKTQEFAQDSDQILNRVRQVEMRSRTFAERVAAKMGLAVNVESSTINDTNQNIFEEIYTSTNPKPGRYKLEVLEGGYYNFYGFNEAESVLLDSASVWNIVDSMRTVNGITFRVKPEFIQSSREVFVNVGSFAQAVQRLQHDIRVKFSPSGSFMTIELEGTDPDILPERLNKIAEVYVLETLKLKKRDMQSYTEVLQERVDAAEQKVLKANQNLRNFYQRYPLNLDAGKESLLEELKKCDRKIYELPKQQDQLTQLLNQLEQAKQDEDYQTSERLVVRQIANAEYMKNEPILQVYRNTFQEQEKQYNNLIDQYSADYQDAIVLGEKLALTQEKILQFARDYLKTMAKQESEYRAKLQNLQSQVKKLPNDEIQLMELQRNKTIYEDYHSLLYSEMNKRQVSSMSMRDNISIMDRAILPNAPIGIGKKEKILFGGAIGFLFGIILAIGIEFNNKKLYSVKEVEGFLGMRVLGAIPNVDFKYIAEYNDFDKIKHMNSQLVMKDYLSNPISESYRALRTSLMFSKKTGKIDTLVITSIAPGEGKSFTASNLALIFAHQGKSTLLVDSDLRRGVLHNSFGVDKEPGFSDYLNGNAILLDVVQQTSKNLSIISCGSSMPNPSELLGSLQMKRFLEEARRKFDLVIIDTPPLNAATDAVVLSTQVDAVAVVIRANYTNRDEAKDRLEVFQTIHANLIGVILNGTESTIERSYYSYNHY